MSLKKEATTAFIWDFLGNISGHVVQFTISVILARILSPSDYGLLGLVNAALALSSVFIDTGLSVSLIQRKDIRDEHYSAVFSFNTTSGLILTLLMFASAGLISNFYNEPRLIPIIRVMSFTFFIGSFGNVIRARLRKDLKNRVLVMGNILSSIISGVVGITMALTNFGIWSLVAQSLLKNTLNNLYLYLATNYRTKFKYNLNALKELWGFGFRVFLSGIMESIFKQLDSFIIAKIAPMATLGFYYRAQSFNAYIIKYASSSLSAIIFPVISKIQDDVHRIKSIVSRSLHFISFLTFGMIGYFYVIGGDIIILLFSDKWEPSVKFFRIILLTGYAYPISSILVGIINGMGNSKSFLKLEVIKKILLSLAFIFGFQFGIEGFLYGYAFMVAIAVYLNYLFAGKQISTGAWWLIKLSLPYLIATTVSVAVFMNIDFLFDLKRTYHFCFVSISFITFYLMLCSVFRLNGFHTFKTEITALIKRTPLYRNKEVKL